MGRQHSDALGGIVLALILLTAGLADGGVELIADDALSRPEDDSIAVSLGWPISPQCGEARVWEALSGIGAARAAALSGAASHGQLRVPADLLRVPGIGIKMAALLAPRVEWARPGTVPVQQEL